MKAKLGQQNQLAYINLQISVFFYKEWNFFGKTFQGKQQVKCLGIPIPAFVLRDTHEIICLNFHSPFNISNRRFFLILFSPIFLPIKQFELKYSN